MWRPFVLETLKRYAKKLNHLKLPEIRDFGRGR